MKKIFSKSLPTIIALLLFLVVAAACFAPQLRGEVLQMHDIEQFNGMSRDIRECREAVGEDPQWTGAMFGGMPAYQINIRYPAQFIKTATDALFGLVGEPISLLFFAMVAMWLMVVMMGYSPWVGIVAGLGYGLSTYFFLIIGAGHITKMWALVFAPTLMGAIYMALRGRAWLGGALAALFGALEIGANHPQITYYFLIAAAALWINDLVFAIRESHIKDFARRTAILAAAALLAAGANFAPLYYTAQHSSDTIRGGSEVAAEASETVGLDLDYATAWSYGKVESMNMFIPDFMGGSSASGFSKDGAVAKTLQEIDPSLGAWAELLPAYWGDQPYTAGPTYIGAVIALLALLGFALASARDRWWIAAASLLALLLAWGRNAMWFTELCFDYLPMYNKFRTVSMALTLIEWTMPLLAAIGLWQLWQKSNDKARLKRALIIATSCAAVMVGVALLSSYMLDFDREATGQAMSEQFLQLFRNDQEAISQGWHDTLGFSVADAMAEERGAILRADALRSLIFVALAAAIVALYIFSRIRRWVMLALLALLVTVDMTAVAFRYFSHDNFTSPRKAKIVATQANRDIMADKTLGYRVLNLTVSPFNDATTSMFHRSVGGYHGAKLSRYQDLISHYMQGSLNDRILDMLNTKYLIVPNNREAVAVERTTALGAAWLVDTVLPVQSPSEELEAIGLVDLATTAIANRADVADSATFSTEGYIDLVEYRPNYLKYEYSADEEAFAIFSEIYYDKGWHAYIDGSEVDYLRVDYLLRGMTLPAGDHVVEWRFRAPNWTMAEAVTLLCSILIVIGLILTFVLEKRYEKQSINEE